MTNRGVYLLGSVAIVVVDALTKAWVISRLPIHESIPIIPGLFNLVHVRNTGAAFGLGANSASPLVPMLLTLGAMAVFGLVVVYSLRTPINERLLQTGLHLILGGAVGNLIDRFLYGSVVDFLDFYVKTHHWPAFNVADSAICIGIGLLFLDMRKKPSPLDEAQPSV